MNHIYRLVWNEARQRYVAAPETASGRGKSSRTSSGKGKRRRLKPASLVFGALLGLPISSALHAAAPAPNTLPTGGKVVAGQAGISQSGSQMTVDQGSDRAVINWNSFDIGSQASVRFNQPSSSAVALNRVVAGDASQIYGRLSSNGQVWLINPNGVIFGAGSRVDVGGLVASTLDTSDADFMAGKGVFKRNGATGSIENHGTLTAADGGLVALLAPRVRNEGFISARLGNVVLAGGDKITLDAGADGLLKVAVAPATIQTLIENRQLVVADGGQIVMTGAAADALSASVVANSGTLQARTIAEKEGRILLLADLAHGQARVGGTIDASAPNGGHGGFVETSGAQVQVAASATVTTKAANGHSGTWLIDPNDFTIAASGGNMTGAAVSSALQNNGNFTISTATQGTAGGNGDIFVNDAVGWSANSTLTLSAERSININAVMSVNGDGKLALNTGAGGSVNTPNFSGRVDFQKSGIGLLTINGADYTVINTVQALQAIGSNVVGKYALGSNMDASVTRNWNGGAGFAPIGTTATPFSGTFEGLGHSISGLTIRRSGENSVGLFGFARNSVLRNLSLTGVDISGQGRVGGLVGYQGDSAAGTSRIANIYVDGRVSGQSNVGGLIGQALITSGGGRLEISNAHTDVTVAGSSSVGGLIGWNRIYTGGYAGLFDVSASGDVNGAWAWGVGGLIGTNTADAASIEIRNAHASGKVVTSDGMGAGGLIGGNTASNGGSIALSHVYATGSVEGRYAVGGLLGSNLTNQSSTITIDHAYATGKTAGYQQVGGLIGDNNAYSGTITIDQTYASGLTSSATDSPGGLIGRHGSGSGSTASLSNSLWDEGSTGQAAAIGSGSSSSGVSSINAGNRHDASAYAALGGTWNCGMGGICRSGDGEWVMIDGNTRPFLASEYSTTIRSAHQLQLMALDPTARYTLLADIDTAATQGGGGSMWSDQGFVPIGNNDAKFTGTFDGGGHTISGLTINRADQDYAGLFGYVQNATLRNVGLLGGSVRGRSFVGTLVGYNAASGGGTSSISNAYATGDVTGESDVGGLVGMNEGDGGTASISNAYATGNVTLNANYAAGGLVGSNLSYHGGKASISYAYATGRVEGTIDVGGLVGRNYAETASTSSISNAYATGDVTGNGIIGGLLGLNSTSSGTVSISNTYATGSVTGNGNLGGLVGWGLINGGPHSVTNSFFAVTDAGGNAINNSGSSDGAWTGNVNGAARTLSDLKKLSTFTADLGAGAWNIDNVGGGGSAWRIYEGDTTPQLRAFMQALTVDAGTLTGKTYDGSKASGIAAGYATSVAGAVLDGALAYSTGAKDAGTYSTADGSLQVGGLYSTKYDISYGTSTLTIGKATLTVRAHSDSKTYDGQAYAGSGIVAMDGFVNNETSTVLTGSLSNNGSSYGAVNAGTYAISLSGLSSSNYAIAYVGGTLTINPALLTGSLVGALGKTYDGTTAVALDSGNFLLTGWGGSDGATVTKTAGSYDNANAGSGKTVSATLNNGDYTAAGGTNLANYILPTTISSNTASIDKAPLTVRAYSDSKTYNGQAYTGTGIVSMDGFVNNETSAVLSGSLNNSGSSNGAVNAGTYGISLSGLSSSNYAITYVGGTLTINPAALTVTASNAGKTYDGIAAGGGYGVSYSGLVNNESAAVLGGFLTYGGSSQGAKNVGSYVITPSGLSSGNYVITYVDGALSITPAVLTVTANNASKIYDGIGYSGGNGVSYSGFVAGEDASVLNGMLTYGGSSQGAVGPGRYQISAGGLSGDSYAITFKEGTLTIDDIPVNPPPFTLPSGGQIWQGVKPLAMPQPSRSVVPDQAGNAGLPFLALAPGFIRVSLDEE